MKKVTYIGARPRSVTPHTGRAFRVEPGDTVEVDGAVADLLLEQPRLWRKPEPKKKSPQSGPSEE